GAARAVIEPVLQTADALPGARRSAESRVAGLVLFARHGLPVSAGQRTVSGSAHDAVRKAKERMKVAFVAWLCAAFAPVLYAQPNPGSNPEVSFATRLEKTAIWVGDQFHYQYIEDDPPKM